MLKKFISKAVGRAIMVREANLFHHFWLDLRMVFVCMDYWWCPWSVLSIPTSSPFCLQHV
jgi:hypothetical protein